MKFGLHFDIQTIEQPHKIFMKKYFKAGINKSE